MAAAEATGDIRAEDDMTTTLDAGAPTSRQAFRLPVWRTTGDILALAWRGKWQWVRVALVPLLLHSVILAALVLVTVSLGATTWPAASARTWVGIAAALLYVPAATAWIRAVSNDTPPPPGLPYRWGPEETRYLARLLQLTLSLVIVLAAMLAALAVSKLVFVATGGDAAPDAPAAALPRLLAALSLTAAGVGVVGLVLWLTADWLMILPAAANGDDSSFRASAVLTRGHRWQIIGIGLCTSAAFYGAILALMVLLALVALIVIVVIAVAMYATSTYVAGAPDAASIGDAGSPLVKDIALSLASAAGPWLSTLMHATALGCVYRRLRQG